MRRAEHAITADRHSSLPRRGVVLAQTLGGDMTRRRPERLLVIWRDVGVPATAALRSYRAPGAPFVDSKNPHFASTIEAVDKAARFGLVSEDHPAIVA